MAVGAHFGCPKFTFDRISGHFISICKFFFLIFDKMAAVGHFGHFISICKFIFYEIFDKMAAVGHFRCPKFTFDRICGHFRSIRKCIFEIFYKMSAAGHFGCSKITFYCIFGHFRSIGHFGCLKFTFDSNSGHFRLIQNLFFRRPFWMSENHFRSHFWPVQIDQPFWNV